MYFNKQLENKNEITIFNNTKRYQIFKKLAKEDV